MVGGLLYAGAGAAQSSKDYAVMARAAWSAYECSSLAGAFEDFQEQQRLFSFGYDQGKRFLAALEAKKVKGDDLNSEAPLVLLLLLAGPSADFMLGRIYSAAARSALDDVYETRGVVHRSTKVECKEQVLEAQLQSHRQVAGRLVSQEPALVHPDL